MLPDVFGLEGQFVPKTWCRAALCKTRHIPMGHRRMQVAEISAIDFQSVSRPYTILRAFDCSFTHARTRL